MKFQKIITPPRINYFKQRGQVAVLYALLIPIFLTFAGVGLDLGWYYLSVSRLQNAADAAVLAGAKDLLTNLKTADSKYKSYNVTLIDKYPADKPYTITNGTKSATDITTEIKSAADRTALKYAQKNLSSNNMGYFFSVAEAAESDDSSMEDSWARKNEYNKVTMKSPEIYKDGEDFYYVVHLEENVQHFFMPGWFEAMNAPVVAVAKLSNKDGTGTGGGDSSARKIQFDANENGDFNKDDTPTLNVTEILDSQDVEDSQKKLTVNLPDGYAVIPKGNYVFDGWYTSKSPADSDTNYLGRTLTTAELDALFGESDTVTLYAKYHLDESDDTQQDAVEEGLSIFGAMKGRVDDYGNRTSRGLEELMTYRTWMEIANEIKSTGSIGILKKVGNGSWQWFMENVNSMDDAYWWADYVATITPGISGKSMSYNSSGKYREETLTVQNILTKQGKENNQNVWYDISTVQSVFFDLGSDLSYSPATKGNGLFKYSWDSSTVRSYSGNSAVYNSIKAKANSTPTSSKLEYRPSSSYMQYRAHTNINIDSTWAVRTGSYLTTNEKYIAYYTDKGETVPSIPASDPLYVRIESEELNEADYDRQNTTVRQMTINVNVDNTGANARPLVIFYEGPDRGLSESYDTAELAGNQTATPKESYPNLTVRDPQPLVLNLNANFKGILFAPNSPVIIKGNGYKMEGFVVAKEFVNDAGYNSYGDLNTSPISYSVKRRPVAGELPYNAKSYEEFVTKYSSGFTAYKAANFANYEYVYDANAAFGLSTDSHYAHFGITELDRTVYTTLNPDTSVDMFFTTIRSKWIT